MDLDGCFTKGFTNRFTIYWTCFTCSTFSPRSHLRSDLCNPCLPEKIQSLAIQKGANTVADLLYLTFQAFLPSGPSARVEGLATIEAPMKPVRTFGEALSSLRSWRQQVLTIVHDLGGNPEPLKLLSPLRTLISSLVASDTAFAMEVSQIYRQTNVKTMFNDVTLLTTRHGGGGPFWGLKSTQPLDSALQDAVEFCKSGPSKTAKSTKMSVPPTNM